MKSIKRQTWSNLDAFALLNGISTWDSQYKNLKYVRTPYDNNLSLRDKINRTHLNPPDIDKQGLLNGLCNEFEIEPYNVLNKTIFTLSYTPVISGQLNFQDISGYYKDTDDTWKSLGSQIWSDTYEESKLNSNGFIVWQNERFANISGYKNFTYSKLVEVFKELPDNTELKFVYYVEGQDVENNKILMQYTDMNNPLDINDKRYTYKISQIDDINLSSDIVCYNLNDIPETIKYSIYYEELTGKAKDFLYDIKKYIDKKFRHTWDKITDKSCIWDVHKSYGSGHIPSFYDAITPQSFDSCQPRYTGYIGGIDSLSYTLYPESLTDISGQWKINIFPGKFYVDNISFYYFEHPIVSQLDFNLISTGELSGYYECNLPSGLGRGQYTIMCKSGYYDSYCNYPKDEFLSNVYEDYSYYTGPEGNILWSDILQPISYLTLQQGWSTNLTLGKYCIDYRLNKIYTNIPSSYNKMTLVWDNTLVPSGTYLEYDLNPLNDKNLTFDKFFLYLSLNII